ncbi:hypothetical protein [Novosphingobium sp. LASN5T]|uniref:hypothetical protein n=1 Tax=Novosphingobium sp. LASN5T TaxID=2491021 RepID=UPI000F600526|nr:hypothetical protein [Novosphingobium sp. LASN5T]RQW38956.1 hypothetical protein EH199_22690 [Novosphingobium sp. LASN5T]
MRTTTSGNLPVARNFVATNSGNEIAPGLLGKYREVLMSSLITSCGLDALIFRNDEVNGHVDTLHNVAESQKNGREPVFKKDSHKVNYENRGDYDSTQYHSDKSYIDKGKEWNQLRDQGKLIDRYTGEPIKPGQKYDRDHVVAAKTIHNDAQFSLSGLDRVAAANSDLNLAPTDRSINRSMQDKSAAEYQAYQAEKAPEWQRELATLKASVADGSAPEGAEKKIHTLEQGLAADAQRVQQAEDTSQRDQSRKHASAYYRSKDFLGTTAWEGGKAGLKMGARQTFGLVLMEVSIAVQEEFPAILEEWRQAPDWKTRLDPRPLLERVTAAVRVAWARVKEKVGDLLKVAGSGFAAGMMAEVMTTVINIFAGTAKSAMRILRNFWAGIVESIKILTFNPDNLGAEDKLAAVMRILSVAVGGMIQPIVAEAIDKLLLQYPLLPSFVREVLSQFAGAALGGIVSVSLVYAIDHSPVVAAIVAAAKKAGEFTDAVYQEIAELTGLAWQALKAAPAALNEMAKSPAVNLAAFVACPPLGAAMLAYRAVSNMQENATRQQAGLERIEMRLSSLNTTIQSGLKTIEALARENNAMLHFVLQKQDQQLLLLKEIRDEIAQGFDQMHIQMRETALEAADRLTLHALQNTLNALLTQYRDCASVLAGGNMPSERDLASIGTLSVELNAQYQTRFNAQSAGAPARLPLLAGMAFALSARRDAMAMNGEDLAICEVAAQRLADLARGELQALNANASFWQLAETNSWLIGQYVVLRRALIAMPLTEVRFPAVANDGASFTMADITVVGWSDGLEQARDLFDQIKSNPDMDTLKLQNVSERDAWRNLYNLPRGQIVREVPMVKFREKLGIPASTPLSQAAGELLALIPEMIEENRKLMERELA